MTEIPNIPLTLHPSVFERHHEKTHGAGITADNAIGAAVQAAAEGRKLAGQALDAFTKIMADETLPLAGRLVRAKRAAGGLIEQAGKKLDAATEKVRAEIDKLNRETNAPPIAASPHALALDTEMRQVLRTSTPEQRGVLFKKAIDGADDSLWRAALNAPAALAGLDDAELQARREQYRKHRHPQAAGRLARLNACSRDLAIAGNALVEFASKLFAPASKFEQAATAANDAAKAAGAQS